MSVRRRPTLPSHSSHEFPLLVLPSTAQPSAQPSALPRPVGPPDFQGDSQDDNEILKKVFILLKKLYEKKREQGIRYPVRPDANQIEYAIHVDQDVIREIGQKLGVSPTRLDQISPVTVRLWMENVGKFPMGGKRKGTKRKRSKRKGTKRKSTKRKSTKRKGTKRKSTKRKSTKH